MPALPFGLLAALTFSPAHPQASVVRGSAEAVVTVSVRNDSDLPVHLQAAPSGCDCTTLGLPTAAVDPHAAVPVTVRIRLYPAERGDLRRSAAFATDHEAGPFLLPVSIQIRDDRLIRLLRDPGLRPSHVARLRQGVGEPQTPDGAIGEAALWHQGKAKSLFLDEQRRGTDFYLQPGICTGDESAVTRGITILDFGFRQQAPDGSFPHVPDVTHGSEFFMEGAARGWLLLEEARDPAAPDVARRWQGPLTRLVDWFSSAKISMGRPDHDLYPFTHRYYARAAAYAEAGTLLGRNDWLHEADRYATLAVARQWPNGVNPEKGGPDAGYQIAGLLYAEYYAALAENPGQRQAVTGMLVKALDFLVAHTTADGEVVLPESTRMGKEKDREGVTKHVSYAAYAQVLIVGAELADRPDYRAVAARLKP